MSTTAVKDAIDALAADGDGTVTPEAVVTAASDPDSPLHDQFDWNDANAAHQQRLAVARALIRSVRYISMDVTERVIKQIQYVHDPRTRSQAYIALRDAATDEALARAIVLEELARIMSGIERASRVAGIVNVDCALNRVAKAIADIQAELIRPPARRKALRSRAQSSRQRLSGVGARA